MGSTRHAVRRPVRQQRATTSIEPAEERTTEQPTYRIVAADARSPRNGRFIEIVGHYNPRTDPSSITVDNDKAVAWLQKGAQPTEAVEKLLKISGAWEQFTGAAS